MKEAYEKACLFLYEITGSCPLDCCDYMLERCNSDCKNNEHGECWQAYFKELAADKEGD